MRKRTAKRGFTASLRSACLLILMVIGMIYTGCYFEGGSRDDGTANVYGTQRQLDRLEADYKAGRITTKEYESRKKQIENGAIIY